MTVVGNPLDLTASLTAGVVSGLDRSATTPARNAALTGLVQFDAAVGAGSLGGPLLNERAEVIGVVVSAVAGSTGQGDRRRPARLRRTDRRGGGWRPASTSLPR